MVSPVFAGRDAELAVLAAAFGEAAGGTPGTVLIGAEAGGGKSRLVTEFTGRVGTRARVLTGGCVELSAAGLPYAPFAAALRELVRERGAAEVTALLPGQAAGELAALLPGFGAPPPGADPETARIRLFELMLALLEALAEQQPLVLVVEDMHWADGPTCDLLSFLVRNLRQAAVLVVVTFRPDGLDGAHPLRRLLAGLERMPGVSRLDLPRLSRDQVAAQLEGILGFRPALPAVSALYERSGGNPLFTEALVNRDGTVRPDLPGSLRDLLLGAVKDLPEQAQQPVRMAAVGGVRVAHGLLAAVTRADDAELTAGLRSAVAASVLVSDGDGYAFRHDLIREAVLGDLLPGERAQAHRRFAEALEASPSLGADGTVVTMVARHWLGARDIERAMTAAWQAAAAAGASFAYAEQLMMAEQVLQLWDQVPDPAERTGADHVSVLMLAADAARWAGQPERGLALVEAALAEVGETGPAEGRPCCGGGPGSGESCCSPGRSMTCGRRWTWPAIPAWRGRRSWPSCAGPRTARTGVTKRGGWPGNCVTWPVLSAARSTRPRPRWRWPLSERAPARTPSPRCGAPATFSSTWAPGGSRRGRTSRSPTRWRASAVMSWPSRPAAKAWPGPAGWA